MRRSCGIWLGLIGWILVSELLSACGDVWGQAIVPASEDLIGGGGGASSGESGGGGAGVEGGAGGANNSGGETTTGGVVSAGGSSSAEGGIAGATTIGGSGGSAGIAGTAGSAGQPTCPVATQVGFATVAGDVSGGAGGAVVKASTAAELKMYAMMTERLIIEISSQITLDAQIRPKSDKTFLGVGDKAELTGGGLYILDEHNVVVQNLKISNAAEDAISIQNSHHVWVDHCDLSSNLTEPKGTYDDLVAVTHGSDYVTVSWTHFHDHYAVSLVGHSNAATAAAEDVGHLTVTYHHNWFHNLQSNTPRVRFGNVHIFNNLFQSVSQNAIISQMGAQVYVEGNVFQSVLIPITTRYEDPDDGGVTEHDNSFSPDSGSNEITLPSSWLPSSSYSYATVLDSTGAVEFLVSRCAGVGKL